MENTYTEFLILFILTFVIVRPPNAEAQVLRNRLKYKDTSLTWVDARSKCRSLTQLERSDLAIVRDALVAEHVSDFCKNFSTSSCWVGLSVEYFHWTQVGSESTVSCAMAKLPMSAANDCSEKYPYICQINNIILVKERKTWEEALNHCRDLTLEQIQFYKNPKYDILSLTKKREFAFAQGIVSEAQMDEAWIGLRWLAGRWVWLDGHPDDSASLPVCPAIGMYCGTLSGKGRQVRNCSERRNFFCYQRAEIV